LEKSTEIGTREPLAVPHKKCCILLGQARWRQQWNEGKRERKRRRSGWRGRGKGEGQGKQ